MIIISGYQGVGKTTFAKKSHKEKFGREIKIIDLESSNYDKTNPEWHLEYIGDIIKIIDTKKTEVLFISSHLKVREELDKLGIKFVFVLPKYSKKELWTEILALRVVEKKENIEEREKNIRALIGHILYFDTIYEEMKNAHGFKKSKRPNEGFSTIETPIFLENIVYNLLTKAQKED